MEERQGVEGSAEQRESQGFDKRTEEIRIPVIRENVVISKEEIETGKVVVSKSVSTHKEPVHLISSHDECKVAHIEAGYYVEQPPAVRQEGDTTIIPVVREEAVVVKKLFLVEEIHITRTNRQTQETQYIDLRTEHVAIERSSQDSQPAAKDGI